MIAHRGWTSIRRSSKLEAPPRTSRPSLNVRGGIAGPKGVDPEVVKILYDAFRKGMEDPIHLQVLEKYDQDPVCMSA